MFVGVELYRVYTCKIIIMYKCICIDLRWGRLRSSMSDYILNDSYGHMLAVQQKCISDVKF